MNQSERRLFLIKRLLDERAQYMNPEIPDTEEERRTLLRSLFNVRMPSSADGEFLRVQDEYLKEEIRRKGTTSAEDMTPVEGGLCLWQGDITTVECDAIVNAANSGMTGCYQPCHNCIDNCIHTFAGVQLRAFCADLMERQGFEEPTGKAKVTPAFNLPCKYVIHTVGPIVGSSLTPSHEKLLASCYRSCLEAAEENGCKSIAFCCISTGVFGFPKRRAAEIAVKTVREYKEEKKSDIKVIFNVFKDEDLEIYREILK